MDADSIIYGYFPALLTGKLSKEWHKIKNPSK